MRNDRRWTRGILNRPLSAARKEALISTGFGPYAPNICCPIRGRLFAGSRRSGRLAIFPAGNVVMERPGSRYLWREAPYLGTGPLAKFVMWLAIWDNQFYHY
jgi:hypothetical protein